MNKKNKMIIGLLAIAVILFCIIQFGIIPADQEKQVEYAKNQTDALTHDITSIEDYKNPYIGNASNVGNLFWNLPLNNVDMKFEIDSEACTLTVNYLDTVWNIGEEKVQRDLIYNSGDSYSFERTQIEDVFGTPLSNLLEQEKWRNDVQDKLKDTDFVEQFYK